ncbi:phospholipase D delta [Tanacetum coccineum]|uniref:Phospholipase D delta n=1 Tax=Tanacetum coccineum TaxID=301880 RepID=A0ABQ5DJI1_9ASTR
MVQYFLTVLGFQIQTDYKVINMDQWMGFCRFCKEGLLVEKDFDISDEAGGSGQWLYRELGKYAEIEGYDPKNMTISLFSPVKKELTHEGFFKVPSKRWHFIVLFLCVFIKSIASNGWAYLACKKCGRIAKEVDAAKAASIPKNSRMQQLWNCKTLITAKNIVIEKSIQTTYIQAIRSTQHFIYIENQYFIGSSYAWSYENAGADNLIPMELAQKIASKIKNKERFAVYVVIPMC